MVYYYGWDRLPPRTHLRVGWLYFWSAWLSLVVIDAILAFMLTPGAWTTSRSFWDGIVNPTYLSSMVARTLGAAGLAGLYALVVAGWSGDAGMKERLGRRAGLGWVLPMAVVTPAALFWYLSAASGAGVPVGEILGTSGDGPLALVKAVVAGSASGQPIAQRAALATLAGSLVVVVLVTLVATVRRRTFGRPVAVLLLIAGLVTIGGAEWTREALRKPYVIGRYMFVNGVRMPPPDGAPAAPRAFTEAFGADPFTVEALTGSGVLAAARWTRLAAIDERSPIDASVARGGELFRLLCRPCHTIDGYLAIRPLVAGKSAAGLAGTIDRLARPVDAHGRPTSWNDPSLRLAAWRGRQMPPFAGTPAERDDLALYLTVVGGAGRAALAPPSAAGDVDLGKRVFEDRCSACHGAGAEWPMRDRIKGRSAGILFEVIGRLQSVNEIMPAFEGSDEERRALSVYLASLATAKEVAR